MNTIYLLVLCAVVASARNTRDDAAEAFETFLETYNKRYNEEEKARRYEIFLKNLEKINDLNKHSNTATFGINQFADLTTEEFLGRHTGYKPSNQSSGCTDSDEIYSKGGDAGDSFDWREKGVVTDVKDQYMCGSWWAFSTTGNVESINAIKTGSLLILSEQQLLDCDKKDFGCYGGLPENALMYFQDSGAMSDDDYPYQVRNGSCEYDATKVKVKISGCVKVQGSEDDLAKKLTNIGPLSIMIDATNILSYSGGVVTGDKCKGVGVNHAALLVGYGKADDGTPYWLVKNSWGTKWGESGYFRMQRGVNCLLILNQAPVSAVL